MTARFALRQLGELSRRREVREVRHILAGAFRLILAAAVVMAAVRAGTRYFYCEGTSFSRTDPCGMTKAAPADVDPAVTEASEDCCSTLTAAPLPKAAFESARQLDAPVDAPLAAVQPPAPDVSPAWHPSPQAQRPPGRRKPPDTARERSARLMVFRT
jgi:hypothetical protein